MNQMSEWEAKFAKRIQSLSEKSLLKFDELIETEINGAFESIDSFVASAGFTTAARRTNNNQQRFRFALADNLWLELVFTLQGFCEVEVTQRLQHPFAKGEPNDFDVGVLPEITEGWVRLVFQNALDQFLATVEQVITGQPTADADDAEPKARAEVHPEDAPVSPGPSVASPKPSDDTTQAA